jgi:hypothetical protein
MTFAQRMSHGVWLSSRQYFDCACAALQSSKKTSNQGIKQKASEESSREPQNLFADGARQPVLARMLL